MGSKKLSKVGLGAVFALTLFSLSMSTLAYEVTTTGGSQNVSNDSNYKRIGVTAFTDLDAFPGNAPGGKIAGVVLECSKNEDGKVGFCTNKDCTNSRTQNSGVKISKEYAEYMENWGYKCFEEIMNNKEFGCEGGVAFCGIGGHAKRNARNNGDTGTPSKHSTGDAMDVSGSMYCGSKKIVDFTTAGRQANPKPYDAFKACWMKTIKEAIAQDSKYTSGGGCIGCPGSAAPANDDHGDHIHMSAPISRPGAISGM